jgi:NHL repeat
VRPLLREYRPVHGWPLSAADLMGQDISDVDINPAGNLLLLARRPPAIIVLDQAGRILAQWSTGLLSRAPHGIAVQPDGSMLCTDGGGNSVIRFTPSGEPRLVVAREPSKTGVDWDIRDAGARVATISEAAGPFNHPTQAAVAVSGEIFVTDGYGNARVHKFRADGTLMASWGQPGVGPGEFHLPHGVAVHPDGSVIVADRENDRLQFFSQDGRFLHEWNNIYRPAAVRCDRDGLVYVAELRWRTSRRSFRLGWPASELPGRVSIFTRGGTLVSRWGSEPPCEPGNFWAPHGIAVGIDGAVYVCEVISDMAGKGLVPADCHNLQKFVPV